MHIVMISSQFPPIVGGVSEYSRKWAEVMTTSGHRVSVITAASLGSPVVQEEDVGGGNTVSVHRVVVRWAASEAARLSTLLDSLRADVVVVQYVPHAYSARGGGIRFAWMMRKIIRRSTAPVIINAHELYGAWRESRRRTPWHVTQRLAVLLLLASGTAFVVTVGQRAVALAATLPKYRRRIHLIPIGPLIDRTTPDPGWREGHGLPKESFVLGTLGLGHWSQDSALLAAAFGASRQSGLDIRLVTAGKMRVENKAAVNLGFLPSDQLSEMLTGIDLFVMPLTDGASGRRSTLVSALGSGTAVLSTYGVDTDREQLGTGMRLTPAGDVGAFARAIVALAASEGELRQLKSAGNELFATTFSWEIVSKQWLALMEACVNNTKIT